MPEDYRKPKKSHYALVENGRDLRTYVQDVANEINLFWICEGGFGLNKLDKDLAQKVCDFLNKEEAAQDSISNAVEPE
jgi:hypothetical protein